MGLPRKKWMQVLLVILILALVVETTIIAIIVYNWSLGSQNFPPFSYNPPVIANCPALTSHPVSQNSQNHTVLFDCSSPTQKMAAFRVFAPLTPTFTHESGKSDLAEPIFTLPPGFLSLFITNEFDPAFSCVGPVPLTSKQSLIIGTYAEEYDYCAEMSNSASSVASFHINWVEGTSPHPTGPVTPTLSLSASPANITISAGGIATSSIEITSRWFKGALALSTDIYPSLFIQSLPIVSLDTTAASLDPNGSVHVTLTIMSSANTTRGTFAIHVVVQSPPAYYEAIVTVKIT